MKRIFMMMLMLLVATGVSFGQAISANGGAIQGSITDPSGASVPGATVVITSPDTGYTKSLQTDSAGFYSVGPLNPGPYKVRISSPGFEALSVNTVIRIGTVSAGTFKLTLGKSSETIEVNAGAIQVNTDQISVSDVLTHDQLNALPINGRNFLDVAQIEPGVILHPAVHSTRQRPATRLFQCQAFPDVLPASFSMVRTLPTSLWARRFSMCRKALFQSSNSTAQRRMYRAT